MSEYIIKLMHSFEVSVRICHPRTEMFIEAKPGLTSLLELTNPSVNRKKNAPIVLFYDTASFPNFISSVFISIVHRDILGECHLISSLPGKASRMLVES